METWQRNLYALQFCNFMVAATWTMVIPFMPVFLGEELGVAAPVAWAGVIAAIGSLCSAASAPVWGVYADRWGRRVMLLRAAVFLCLGYVFLGFARDPYHVLAARVSNGLFTGFLPLATALVGTTTPRERVGWALALLHTGTQAGNIIGPLVGGVLADTTGIRGIFWVSAVAMVVCLVVVWRVVREQFVPRPRAAQGRLTADLRATLGLPGFAPVLLASMAAVAGISALDPVMVPFIKSLAGPTTPNWVAGMVYSLPGITFVLTASWWSRQGQRWGFGLTLTLGMGLSGALLLAQVLAPTVWTLGALRTLQGVALGALMPGVAALVATVVPPAARGKAFGIDQSARSVGYMLGPLVGGWIGTWLGARPVLLVTGVLLLAAAWWLRRRLPAQPV